MSTFLEQLFEDISAQQQEKIANAAPNDVITVYHGTPKFRLPLLINGFDATQVISRDYGGPEHRGLFITPDFEVAKGFGGGAIIEIRVSAKFIHGTDYSGNIGRKQKKEKGDDIFDWIKEKFPKSFRPYMSYTMLSMGTEPQGLLIGVVKPSQITKVWIRDLSSGQWVEYDRQEYLEKQDVYNQRRVLDRYEQDTFLDAGIDMANPKMDLEEFVEALMKTQGNDRQSPEEQAERFIKMLKFYGEKRGSEDVEEKLAYIEIGGSRLGQLARKNLVKQVMDLVKEDEMVSEGITRYRFKQLAGICD